MSLIRIIAIETANKEGFGPEPIIGCAFINNCLHVYDTCGEIYLQKEYFRDFNSLDYMVKKGRYEWADFMVESGQTIFRDRNGVGIDEQIVPLFKPLAVGKNTVGKVSLKLFSEFLKTACTGQSEELAAISNSYANGELRGEINRIIAENPLGELMDLDKELIVKARVIGRRYIISWIKGQLASDDYRKTKNITFYFTRLFKLEAANYISVN